MSRLGTFLLVAGLSAGLVGCGANSGPSDYEQQIMQDRVDRDMEMREKESVLPPSRRAAFQGLDYYDVDPAYRFVVPFERQSSPDTVMLAQSTGQVREQVRVGHVTLPLPAGDARLAVFRGANDGPRGRLWIPYADATNGDETYKAGRYVDLDRAEGDSVVVDLNRTYNPTCTYNPDFACPLPPAENHLDAAVPVGEKVPQFQDGTSS